ncbi:tRNA wybutosine-synthesizing protein 2/3/4 [Babesia sp. Xinjiang]|uniref:tRNA wybutosine-synthesizing protein 2/3/4 n=1 Tax=Babesia sp. Xinjiang TaxID=462227 RepID=UPI000A26055E|nr:tRNA wybutosine-synthesizing protein 2/3/4 [Babesia sp. Xinjiang]ORM41445.1 tRNA wybutosine-synthesizing protein 2/3/4 [Babesia sp. Xinjiang]
MDGAIRSRFGHSVDAFLAVTNQHGRLAHVPSDTEQSVEKKLNQAFKNAEENDVLLYQNKMALKERVAIMLGPVPKNVDKDAFYERVINAEESRQVIHGKWKMCESDKFWDTISREEEIDAHFDGMNPATLDDYVTGRCNIQPEFKTKYIKGLLPNVPGKQTLWYEAAAHSADISGITHKKSIMLIMFGGAIPSDKQLRGCDGKLSLTNIIDSVHDLMVTDEVFTVKTDDTSKQWVHVETKSTPSPRAFHAATVIYTNLATPLLCVTGGFGGKRLALDMTLHILPLQSNANQMTWTSLKTDGKMPKPRYGHTMGQVGEYLTIFGGTNGTEIFNDLWVFNLNRSEVNVNSERSYNVWKRVEVGGLVPPPRCFHAAVKIGIEADNPIVVYGGVTIDDSSRAYAIRPDKSGELRWSMLPITVNGPAERRAFHSMIYYNGQIIIAGGEDFTSAIPTVHQCLIYSIGTRDFQYTEETLPLSGHRSVVIKGIVSHYGGLRSVASRVFLEPISGQRDTVDTLDIQKFAERQYMEEILKEIGLEVASGRPANQNEPCADAVCALKPHAVNTDTARDPLRVGAALFKGNLQTELAGENKRRPQEILQQENNKPMHKNKLKRWMAEFYKQVHPDVTRHLKEGLCQQNSNSVAQLNSYLDQLYNPREAINKADKTLVFHKVDGTSISLKLRPLGSHTDVKSVVYDIINQVRHQEHTQDLLSDVDHAQPGKVSWRGIQNDSKKDLTHLFYKQALDAVIGRQNESSDPGELAKCAKLYDLGVDPRLIFFDKMLTGKQREDCINTLQAVAKKINLPQTLIIFTDRRNGEPNGKALRIPTDVNVTDMIRIIMRY